MFRKFLATTAIVGLMAGGAYAQETPTPAPAEPAPTTTAPADSTAVAPVEKADGLLATNIIGESVYNGAGENAETVGKVNDLVIDGNGAIKSLVVGVGGFLGIGEKNVEVDYQTASWSEKDGDRWIVISMTKEQLEGAPAFDRAPYDPVAPMPTAATPETPPADTATPPAAAPEPVQPEPAN